ncbi:MAG: recombinase family protein [Deltaproteobacteria bacterium]|nr:recombinase family protein [Deltaproteobacteria bacterium]
MPGGLSKRSFAKTRAGVQKIGQKGYTFYLIYPSQESAYRFAVPARINKTCRKIRLRTAGRLIGYARVSTGAQDLSLQLDALQQQGCRKPHIFIDKGSGGQAQRPGLDACLKMLQPGDVLLVWRLDRLGRSMPHLVTLIATLRERGVGFRSLCDGALDTTTASGELVFTIFSALAQFEQRLIQERTRAGLKAARARGHRGGRKPIRPDDPRVTMAKTMHTDTTLSITTVCRTLNISRATFYRYLSLSAKLGRSL